MSLINNYLFVDQWSSGYHGGRQKIFQKGQSFLRRRNFGCQATVSGQNHSLPVISFLGELSCADSI